MFIGENQQKTRENSIYLTNSIRFFAYKYIPLQQKNQRINN